MKLSPRKYNKSSVKRLNVTEVADVVSVFCDAFYNYPVMRFVIGSTVDDYGQRLHTLIEFFVMARVWRNEPVIGIARDGRLVASAILTLPDDKPAPPELIEHRELVWAKLGQSARNRYETCGEVWREFIVSQPHYHLNMIGVRNAYTGQGLAGELLDRVHRMSLEDAHSGGVTLTTESTNNVPLYKYLGYQIIGRRQISPELDTWFFFRPDDIQEN